MDAITRALTGEQKKKLAQAVAALDPISQLLAGQDGRNEQLAQTPAGPPMRTAETTLDPMSDLLAQATGSPLAGQVANSIYRAGKGALHDTFVKPAQFAKAMTVDPLIDGGTALGEGLAQGDITKVAGGVGLAGLSLMPGLKAGQAMFKTIPRLAGYTAGMTASDQAVRGEYSRYNNDLVGEMTMSAQAREPTPEEMVQLQSLGYDDEGGVSRYQTDHGLVDDGEMGPKTSASLAATYQANQQQQSFIAKKEAETQSKIQMMQAQNQMARGNRAKDAQMTTREKYPWVAPVAAGAGILASGLAGRVIGARGARSLNKRMQGVTDSWGKTVKAGEKALDDGRAANAAYFAAAAKKMGSQHDELMQAAPPNLDWKTYAGAGFMADLGLMAPTIADYVGSDPGTELHDRAADDLFSARTPLRMAAGTITGAGAAHLGGSFGRSKWMSKAQSHPSYHGETEALQNATSGSLKGGSDKISQLLQGSAKNDLVTRKAMAEANAVDIHPKGPSGDDPISRQLRSELGELSGDVRDLQGAVHSQQGAVFQRQVHGQSQRGEGVQADLFGQRPAVAPAPGSSGVSSQPPGQPAGRYPGPEASPTNPSLPKPPAHTQKLTKFARENVAQKIDGGKPWPEAMALGGEDGVTAALRAQYGGVPKSFDRAHGAAAQHLGDMSSAGAQITGDVIRNMPLKIGTQRLLGLGGAGALATDPILQALYAQYPPAVGTQGGF